MSWEDSPGEVTDYICENVFNLRDYQLKIIAYLSIYIYLAKLCMQILLYISLMTSKTKKKLYSNNYKYVKDYKSDRTTGE